MSLLSYVFFLMIRRPPRSTRTDTLFPYTTLFRSAAKPLDIGDERRRVGHCVIVEADDSAAWADLKPADPRRAAIELGRDQRQQVFGGIGQGAETVDHPGGEALDRKSGVEGKSVSVSVDLGGRRLIKKKKTHKYK